jgi:hypothetical protein
MSKVQSLKKWSKFKVALAWFLDGKKVCVGVWLEAGIAEKVAHVHEIHK